MRSCWSPRGGMHWRACRSLLSAPECPGQGPFPPSRLRSALGGRGGLLLLGVTCCSWPGDKRSTCGEAAVCQGELGLGRRRTHPPAGMKAILCPAAWQKRLSTRSGPRLGRECPPCPGRLAALSRPQGTAAGDRAHAGEDEGLIRRWGEADSARRLPC